MSSQVVVSGDRGGRGLISGHRSPGSWIGLSVSVGALLLWLMATGFQWWSLLVAVPLAPVAFLAWSERDSLGSKTPVGWLAARLMARWRSRWRSTSFTPRRLLDPGERPRINAAGKVSTEAADAKRKRPVRSRPAKRRKALRAQRTREVNGLTGVGADVPPAVGHIRPYRLELEDGSNACFIRQYPPSVGSNGALLMVFEQQASRRGAVEMSAGSAAGWSKFLASLASMTSYVGAVSETARAVPWDYADHMSWMREHVDLSSPDLVRQSYAELVDAVRLEAEQHRHWLTLSIPRTSRWLFAAGKLAKGERGEALLAYEEARAVLAAAKAHNVHLRLLGEKRSAAVIRALQDPDVPIDRNEDVDWSTCWLPYEGADQTGKPDRVVFQGCRRQWHTATFTVPRAGIAPGWLPTDFLRPLLTGVSPAVVRTVTVTHRLIPEGEARRQARRDVATDRISLRRARGRVTDGSEDSQALSSVQRLTDLRPGMGAAGLEYTLAVTFQSPSPEAFDHDRRVISHAAESASITRPEWQDNRQDLAWVAALPMVRGLARPSRWAKL